MGNYDFDRIVQYAKKRFVEGCNTIELMGTATTEREKEEIALVSMLDVGDDKIRDLELSCKCTGKCKTVDCRDKLKKIIGKELAFIEGCEYPFL